jgi:hypothetical protein
MDDIRGDKGHFKRGNPGGPGRPRRAVERQYLAALSDAVPLDAWRAIVEAAVEAAKNGDARARDWLARYLVGEHPLSLADLAADEAVGLGAERDVLERLVRREQARDHLAQYSGDDVDRARRLLGTQSQQNGHAQE